MVVDFGEGLRRVLSWKSCEVESSSQGLGSDLVGERGRGGVSKLKILSHSVIIEMKMPNVVL